MVHLLQKHRCKSDTPSTAATYLPKNSCYRAEASGPVIPEMVVSYKITRLFLKKNYILHISILPYLVAVTTSLLLSGEKVEYEKHFHTAAPMGWRCESAFALLSHQKVTKRLFLAEIYDKIEDGRISGKGAILWELRFRV